MKAQVPETQQQPKDQRRVIFQERQRKPLNQEAGLRSKAFNNRKSFGLKQFLGGFWGQRNSEKRAGSWDCVARHYISFFLSFLMTMSLLQYFSPHLACTLLSVYRSTVNLQFCVSFKCTARWFKYTVYIYICIYIHINSVQFSRSVVSNSAYTHTHTHIYILFKFFSIKRYYKILNTVLCAIQ